MGVSGSAPVAPHNKHLAHVRDPRSPSAGIFRTPIEVVSSPAGSPQPGAAEPVAGSRQAQDPRSPTPGVSHTPRRAVSSESLDRLVRQLNEAFGAETAAQEPGPAGPDEEPVVEEPARRSSPPAAAPGDEAERPPSPSAAPARPARLAGPGFSSGSKPVRRKTNNKIMTTSGGTGRSPLSILQDDNSPSAPAPRQVNLNEPYCGRENGLKKHQILQFLYFVGPQFGTGDFVSVFLWVSLVPRGLQVLFNVCIFGLTMILPTSVHPFSLGHRKNSITLRHCHKRAKAEGSENGLCVPLRIN
ncbi:cell division cycle-associated protein 3 isoform X1 [Aquila chrysaetos chrysaetos]|uniref:cell division cycle-associated protein 3 isoform X1 n=1 Tax=Aquila chrysaetos chrysaetos TaxID=223781 RepID=UPI0011770EBA|nr:cell division cycle-associated protein 3 isoform X1 [Aquila chrysaetos chrysaetos]